MERVDGMVVGSITPLSSNRTMPSGAVPVLNDGSIESPMCRKCGVRPRTGFSSGLCGKCFGSETSFRCCKCQADAPVHVHTGMCANCTSIDTLARIEALESRLRVNLVMAEEILARLQALEASMKEKA